MDPQSMFNQAMALHQEGKLAEAEPLYRDVIRAAPTVPGAYFLLGALQSQLGRNDEALGNYERAISLKPDLAEAHLNQGVLLWQMRRPADALKSYDKVVGLQPKNPQGHYNRGVVLSELGRPEDAVTAFDRALALEPEIPAALCNRGIAQWMLKLHDAALDSFDRALALQPDFASAHYNRGLVLAELKRTEDALASFDKALAAVPDFAAALSSKGLALLDLRRPEEALAAFDASLALQPRDVETLTNRGLVLASLGRPEEALASYDQALAVLPGFVPAWVNRGHVLKTLGRLSEAGLSYDRALAVDTNNAELWNMRGVLLNQMHNYDEAVKSFNSATAIRPDYPEALHNRGHILWAHMGEYKAAVWDYQRVIALDPGHAYSRGELQQIRMYGGDWRNYDRDVALIDDGVRAGQRVIQPFIYQALSSSPADLQACSRIFADTGYPALAPLVTQAKQRGKKIRIGYVSSDFREQATSYLTAGLYEQHDKKRFEIIAFDNGYDDKSPIRARLEAAFDKFIPITALTDAAAAERIAAEEIDILVNLNGYFGSPRMNVFARRPAPVQVNWLGFPATLGTPYIDYIIADKTVIPADERRFYTEQVVWLPESYQANDDKRAIGEDTSRAAQALPDGGFVFCNFNQSYKIAPSTFRSWMAILKQVEGSVLWLLETMPEFDQNARAEAERQGVAGDRLIFAPAVPLAKHLARLKLADLFLDTLPYNAHTTASDALWAGLPLLSLRGTAFPGRVAASLLAAAGLPELITETPQDFEALAVSLAKDKAKLKALRAKLAKNRTGCALFDTRRFARHLEAAYQSMWETALKGEAPKAFAVEPIA